MADKPLTDRAEQFCQEYTICYNRTRAAILAGYSVKTAAKQGCKLMKDPRVQARIREIQKELFKECAITRERLALELMEAAEICKAAKPVMVWNTAQHAYVESGEYQIDGKNLVRALEAVGKFLGFDKQEINPDAGPVFISGDEELKP